MEQRNLMRGFEQAYLDYRKRAPMILPIPVRRTVTKVLKDEDIV